MNFSTYSRAAQSLLYAFLIFPALVYAAAPGAPTHLQSCNKAYPSGTDNRPYFGWYVNDADNNEVQTAYQVQVFSKTGKVVTGKADVWDSGKIHSGNQNYVDFAGSSILPATRYYWRVRTWDKNGNAGPYSTVAWFDTGLFANADWSGAKWIKRNSTDADDYTYFRKDINLPAKAIKRAMAYISVCHNYELYISGKLIGKGSVNAYPQYGYYHAYDITPAVKAGKTTIACLTHWYGGGQGRAPGARGLLVKVAIEYADGTRTVVVTDASWKQKRDDEWVAGQARRGGEGAGFVDRIDSRNVLAGWNLPSFNAAAWDAAEEIGAQPVAPWTNTLQTDLTRLIEKEIKPVSVKDLGGKKYLVDLGKVMAGMPKIAFAGGTAGDVVNIHGAYLLNDDGISLNPRSNQSTNLDYFFILNGKSAVFNPKIYFGYRYLLIENSPNPLTVKNVSFITRHYDLDPSRAGFSSSDAMLNKVWELMLHSLIVNAHENFVDTPTREKGAFLGDGGYQGPPAMSTMGDRNFNQRALREFLESQDQYWPDGRLNAVYPNVDGKRDIPDYTQGYLVWVNDYYMQSGDLDFLKDNYPRLKKIGEYVDAYQNKSTGLIDKLAGGGGGYIYGIIDWPQGMRYGYDMSAVSRTVIDALAYIDYDHLSSFAAAIGNTADRDAWHAKAMAMKDAINTHLINKDGVYIDGLKADLSQSTHVSQQANMYPLAIDIVPDQDKAAVVNAIKERKMSVGMVTVRMLPEALGKANEGPHLLELYTNPTWDGWAQTVSLGGTTTWEEWRANTTTGSMSHAWGSIGLLGMQNYILGVTVLKPQHELIQVKPLDFEGKLKQAQGSFPSDRGDIKVNWNRDSKHFFMTLTLPDNVTAKVYVPKSGTTGTKLKVDAKAVNGTDDGGYVFAGMVGSGVHTFERLAQ